MPDSYGLGLGMMGGIGGGMGINNLPGSNTMLYGRGMGYGGGVSPPSSELHFGVLIYGGQGWYA